MELSGLPVADPMARLALVPGEVERFRCEPQLDNEFTGQILRLCLTPLLAPQPGERGLVAAHDNAGVGAADEMAAVAPRSCEYFRAHDFLHSIQWRLICAYVP